jgi:hypothetical protein
VTPRPPRPGTTAERVLKALLAQPGQPIRNEDLLAAAWPPAARSRLANPRSSVGIAVRSLRAFGWPISATRNRYGGYAVRT